MTDNDNIHAQLATYLKDIGLSPGDCGGEIVFTGADPILHSRIRLGACLAIPAAACGVGAAAIWKDRTGEGQNVSVDLREAVWNITQVPPMVPCPIRATSAPSSAAEMAAEKPAEPAPTTARSKLPPLARLPASQQSDSTAITHSIPCRQPP